MKVWLIRDILGLSHGGPGKDCAFLVFLVGIAGWPCLVGWFFWALTFLFLSVFGWDCWLALFGWLVFLGFNVGGVNGC